ncbi:MAG: HNH endonuclease [Gammaproteobacteria bacterium]|nr:HNH endonuclease [Gammaproteobacteria bacterium]MDP2347360.1 HNH endonuclease [Gammaproteobacteria bacterium]
MAKLKRNYSRATLNKLFALSYNKCAYPNCENPIVVGKTESSDEAIVGQICHIYAIAGNGPRAKPGLTSAKLNAIDNLILCCGHHHTLIDKQHESFPAELLIQWKQAHESRMGEIVREGFRPIQADVFHHQVFREDLVDAEIEKQVDVLKKSRFFQEFDKQGYALKLGRELIDRSLSGGNDLARCKGLSWCARVLSLTDERATAQGYLDSAKALGVCQEVDIAEAFLLGDKGRAAALSKLGNHQSPEARTAALMIISTRESLDEALNWLETTGLSVGDLDSDGRLHLLTRLLEEERWGQALKIADSGLHENDFDHTPALLRVVAMTNLVNAIPDDFRTLVVKQVPFGAGEFPLDDNAAGFERRDRAILLFRKAGNVARQLNCHGVASFDEDFLLWLELRDPEKHEEARGRLEEAMENAATGLRLVALALDFGVALDREKIHQEIEKQIVLNGCYTFETAIARFSLAFMRKSEDEVVDYLDKYEEELIESKFLEPNTILALKAEMLARAGKTELARVYMDRVDIAGGSQSQLARLKQIIERAKGEDTLGACISQFNASNDIQDLIALVRELESKGKMSELIHYAEILFEKTHSLTDVARLSQAYFKHRDYERIVVLFSEHSSYLKQSHDLVIMFAWSLYHLGRLTAALSELKKLPVDYDNPNVSSLRISIAITSGNWNALTVILASEYEKREKRTALELIRLAKLAFQMKSVYAKDFLLLAVGKGEGDAQILMNAYIIATGAGIEDEQEIAQWLMKAVEFSGPNGPVQRMTLDDILERKPQWDKQSNDIWDKVVSGLAPMFLAADVLHKSLVEFFLFPAIANLGEVDPRGRGVIPAYSGKRPILQAPIAKSIGLDTTALLTLAYLKVLEKVIVAFDNVYIPHSTMAWLFNESSKASFHQPSRIRKAHQIRELVSTGALVKLESYVPATSDLSAMVGVELAQLLSEARSGGQEEVRKYVVRSSPVHHVGSLRKGEADLSEYSNLLCSCQAVIDKLKQLGRVSVEEEKEAKAYLSLHENPWPQQPEIANKATLFLDGLAVTYFLHLGVLERLQSAGFKVVVSEREIEDGNNLISYERSSGKVRDVIEHLLSALSQGMQSDKVTLGKSALFNDDEEPGNKHPTFETIMLANQCDVVVVDDRFLNQHPNIDGGINTAKINTSLDLLHDLCRGGNISGDQLIQFKTQLRQACIIFIPLDEDELMHHIQESGVRDGDVIESLGLRAIREYILKIRMGNWLTLPEEALWIESIFRTLSAVLKRLWQGDEESESIIAKAEWVLELFDLRGWAHRLIGDMGDEVGNTARLPYVLLLISVPPEMSEGRHEEYWNWLDSKIVIPMKEEYPELYDLIVDAQKKYFDHLKGIDPNDVPHE